MRLNSFHRKQRGEGLTSVLLALAISAILIAGNAREQQEQLRDIVDRSSGGHAVLVHKGVQRYLDTQRSALLAGTAIASVADPLAPTLTELRAIGSLDSTASDQARNGMTYNVSIRRMPTGCTVGVNCNDVTARIFTSPVVDASGDVSPVRAGRVADVVGADATVSNPGTPGVMQEWGNEAHPAPAGQQRGSIVLRAGFGSSGSLDWVFAKDGSRVATGNWNLGGFNIGNAASLTANTSVDVGPTGLGCSRTTLASVGEIYVRAANCVLRTIIHNNGVATYDNQGRWTSSLWNDGAGNGEASFNMKRGVDTQTRAYMDTSGTILSRENTPDWQAAIVPTPTGGTIQVGSGTGGVSRRIWMDGRSNSLGTLDAAGNWNVRIDGNTGRIGAAGIDPNNIPAGWTGGVVTSDAIAHGQIAVRNPSTGGIAFAANNVGDFYTWNHATGTSKLHFVTSDPFWDGSVVVNGQLRGDTVLPVKGGAAGQPCGGRDAWSWARDGGHEGWNGVVYCGQSAADSSFRWRRVGLNSSDVGTWCPTEGMIAQTPEGVGLVCVGNFYRNANDYRARVVDLASVVVTNGSVVNKPSCGSGGTQSAFLGDGIKQVDPSGISNAYVENNPSSPSTQWVVRITTGSGASAGPSPQSIVRVACIYV